MWRRVHTSLELNVGYKTAAWSVLLARLEFSPNYQTIPSSLARTTSLPPLTPSSLNRSPRVAAKLISGLYWVRFVFRMSVCNMEALWTLRDRKCLHDFISYSRLSSELHIITCQHCFYFLLSFISLSLIWTFGVNSNQYRLITQVTGIRLLIIHSTLARLSFCLLRIASHLLTLAVIYSDLYYIIELYRRVLSSFNYHPKSGLQF